MEKEKVMDDLISRRAVLDAYSELYWIDERLLNFEKELDSVYDKINSLPSEQPEDRCGECDAWNKYKNYTQEPQWIPCSERLPEREFVSQKRHWYLTTNYYGNVGITEYVFEDYPFFKCKGWKTDLTIIAWCELPEPWRGEES